MQRKEIKKEVAKKDWKKYKIGIVVAEFNSDITGKLLDGAVGFLKQHGFQEKNIEVKWVPGSFELPLVCQQMAQSKKFDGIIALGCVIKGDTDHYYYVAGEASRGLMNVMLNESMPIGFGLITTNNLKQAQVRSGKHNKGIEAAEALLKTIAALG